MECRKNINNIPYSKENNFATNNWKNSFLTPPSSIPSSFIKTTLNGFNKSLSPADIICFKADCNKFSRSMYIIKKVDATPKKWKKSFRELNMIKMYSQTKD